MTFTEIPPAGQERHGERQEEPDKEQEFQKAEEASRSEGIYDSFASPFQEKSLVAGPEGMGIMLLGVVLPALLLGAAAVACCDRITMMILKHPLETLIEITLAAMVPVSNLVVWRSLCRDDRRFAKRRGIMNGIAIGSSAVIAAVAWAAVILHYPAFDALSGNPHPGAFTSIAIIASLASAASLYVANLMRLSRELRSSQLRTVMYSFIGIIFSAALFVGSEARSVCIRVAEYMSTSESLAERKNGLDFLRRLNPERDLMMECADVRAAGIPGLFIRLEPTTQRQLYFAVTGKPFRDDKSSNYSSMPDDYLQRHVVGAPVAGLSLIRSAMTGVVNPDTLSATINWTFVFKNRTYNNQEARAEIGLPEGAVISKMTLWPAGEPYDAKFNPSGEAAATFEAPIEVGHDAPAICTDLGRGRTLLHCYPVPPQSEMKVRVAVAVPLKLHTLTEASVSLPRFIDNNFAIASDNSISIRSSEKLSMNLKGIRAGAAETGQKVLVGQLKEEDLSGSGLSIRVARKAILGPNVVMDPFVRGTSFIVQTIRKVESPAPNHLVLVVDGSQSVKEHLKELQSAFAKLPQAMHKSIVIASDQNGGLPEILSFKDGLKKLETVNLTGGQDNLQAVVKAAELAGETKGGAVLWVHGPQPSFNEEIYIMAPYIATPKFYELALDNGVMDAHEFFKNHREIGPFTAIARSATAGDDLERFIAKWQPGGTDFSVDYTAVSKAPVTTGTTAQQASEIASLAAVRKVEEMLQKGKVPNASVIACVHNIVTPVSLASVILDNADGNRINHMRNRVAADPNYQVNEPGVVQTTSGSVLGAIGGSSFSPKQYEKFSSYSADLQGATNGTVGPAGNDVQYITGVNTAGTVRVNNMANLESMLNFLAVACEIVGIVFGGVYACSAIFAIANGKTRQRGEMTHYARLACGVLCIVGGLITPSTINWFVASARDANLFS